MSCEKPAFKLVKTRDAVGHVLCHDLTQIIPGQTKDARFKMGHIVSEQDIPVLLAMGKDNLYVWEEIEGMLHENQAAEHLIALCRNLHMRETQVKEGKIELLADKDGLFTVDAVRLNAVNAIGEMALAARHTNSAVKAGDLLLAARVIPLVIPEGLLKKARTVAGAEPLTRLVPWKLKTAAIVTTGNEVFNGRIEDRFTGVIISKLKPYGIEVTAKKIAGDSLGTIQAAILEMKETSPDMILCAGGMSVDPDDLTPAAIRAVCQNIVTYGVPVLSVSMFMLGYFGDKTPILGLPGCVMYGKPTVFDRVLPRIAAGLPLSHADFAAMGHGGLCLRCGQCFYPNCAFGK